MTLDTCMRAAARPGTMRLSDMNLEAGSTDHIMLYGFTSDAAKAGSPIAALAFCHVDEHQGG